MCLIKKMEDSRKIDEKKKVSLYKGDKSVGSEVVKKKGGQVILLYCS